MAEKYALDASPIKTPPVTEARAALDAHNAARPSRDNINALTQWALKKELLQTQLDLATGRRQAQFRPVAHPKLKPGQIVTPATPRPARPVAAPASAEPTPRTDGRVLAPRIGPLTGTPGEIRRTLEIAWNHHEALMAELDQTERAGLRLKLRRKLYRMRGVIAAASVALGLPEPSFPMVSNYRSSRKRAA